MSIDNKHPTYVKRSDQWRKCRDAYEGEDAIKAAGVRYLPKLTGQSDVDYKSYKNRAMFYSITSKSVAAMVGMATMTPAKLKYPDSMAYLFTGVKSPQFMEVFSTALNEILLQSRFGMLIDWGRDGKPYIAMYAAEDMTNWRFDKDSSDLEFLMLQEVFDKYIDEYTIEQRIRYRELRMIDGIYTQILHEDGEEAVTITPTISGIALEETPFFAVNPVGLGLMDCKPMMLDIANINISHYLSSADLEHGRHFTGLPTPVVMGADASTDLYIGSTKFLILPEKGADAKYLEFTGQGLQSLEKAMSEKQSQLASLSARLLDNSTRGSESTDAVKMRYMSETASLTTVILALQTALNVVYKQIAVFLKEDPDEVQITLDIDFMDVALSPAEMTALFNGYIEGAIGLDTLIFNLRKGRRLNPDAEDSEVKLEIEARVKDLEAVRKTVSEATGKTTNQSTTSKE